VNGDRVRVADVTLGDAVTPIEAIRGGASAVAGAVAAQRPTGRLLVVTDSNIRDAYARPLVDALVAANRSARLLCVDAGEGAKSPLVLATLWDDALAEPLDRGDAVVAVGGGVVGDLAGFLAATLLRGIAVVQVPTTVLAMADASIGGKTGINVALGKNLVGAFHQPVAVLQWIDALLTLDAREYRSGLAEVVKSALIDGEEALVALEATASSLAVRDGDALLSAIAMAARLKAGIVSRDVHEQGERALLNLGHTFGHAIEHGAGYGGWTHGEAVAAGMMCALRYGASAGLNDSALVARVEALLSTLGLPTRPPTMTLDAWLGPMTRDKKRAGDEVKLILCRRPGACEVVRTGYDALSNWLRDSRCAIL